MPKTIISDKENKVKETPNKVVKNYADYINPSLARLMKLLAGVVVEERGDGAVVKDINGKEYIDCLGGYGVFNCGHSHPEIIKAVKEQLDIMPLSTHILFSKPQANLAEMLANLTPGNLQYSFFCNSGAEAVEGAVKLAKLYTGKQEIISAQNSFHGKTLGALSVSGRELYKKQFEPLLPGVKLVPFGDAGAIERGITKDTAAVILEPIQGEGGVVVPPDDYLPQVRKICHKKKVLLILDEIQTGLGRTGRLFACEHYNIVPDIMCLAKALGGGVMPIGAFIATPRVWSAFISQPVMHTSTFGGNPLACSAAMGALKVVIKEKLADKARDNGEYLRSKLTEIKERHPNIIADVRGKGLLIGAEMTREGLGGTIFPEMIKMGVITAFTLNNPKVIRFEPPLIITKKQIDKVVECFEKAVIKAKGLSGTVTDIAMTAGKKLGILKM